MTNLNLIFSVFFSLVLFIISCNNSKTLDSIYDKHKFHEDFKTLLDESKIDTSTYYRGIILQDYAENHKAWKNKPFSEIQSWINKQIRWEGFQYSQEYKDDFLEFSMTKKFIDTTQLNFNIEFKTSSHNIIQPNDTIRFYIVDLNLLGDISHSTEVWKTISEEAINNEKFTITYNTHPKEYLDEIPLWKCSEEKIKEIPLEQIGKLSEFNVIKYSYSRKGKILKEVQVIE